MLSDFLAYSNRIIAGLPFTANLQRLKQLIHLDSDKLEDVEGLVCDLCGKKLVAY